MPNSSSQVPAPDQYRQAIQNPSFCFQSDQLQEGEPATDDWGLPKPRSGSFAVVFRLQRSGKADVAVRCFTQSITDQKRRYSKISQALSSCSLDALVGFEYMEREIRVDGQEYPVLKMDWVSGIQLDQYVEKNYSHHPSRLASLAEQWKTLLGQLVEQEIAHGDLSSGNILVNDQGQIRLVDYDGIYVPSLRNDPPSEFGTPDYQHPERLERGHYDANSDSFAGLVIYLSLKAIAERPELWDRYYTGENLIFEQEDFERPGRTSIWNDLQSVSDSEIKGLADTLENWCRSSVTGLPRVPSFLEKKKPHRPGTGSLDSEDPPATSDEEKKETGLTGLDDEKNEKLIELYGDRTATSDEEKSETGLDDEKNEKLTELYGDSSATSDEEKKETGLTGLDHETLTELYGDS